MKKKKEKKEKEVGERRRRKRRGRTFRPSDTPQDPRIFSTVVAVKHENSV